MTTEEDLNHDQAVYAPYREVGLCFFDGTVPFCTFDDAEEIPGFLDPVLRDRYTQEKCRACGRIAIAFEGLRPRCAGHLDPSPGTPLVQVLEELRTWPCKVEVGVPDRWQTPEQMMLRLPPELLDQLIWARCVSYEQDRLHVVNDMGTVLFFIRMSSSDA